VFDNLMLFLDWATGISAVLVMLTTIVLCVTSIRRDGRKQPRSPKHR
jgi:hypothetical protein